MAVTLEQTKAAIDAVAKQRGFRCLEVSWEDASRWNGPGGLSCVGPNISDVRLWEKTGRLLYTCRSESWNERLGYVAAKDVAMVTGNQNPVASTLESTTLQDYLERVGTNAGYMGIDVPSLYEPTVDDIFSIRFQTVFLPVGTGVEQAFGGTPPSTEFCTEVYNYQTRTADDPRNLLLLATPQGTSAAEDKPGRAKVFYHSVDTAGQVHEYWLEAEKSEHKVGGSQVESKEEAAAAARRGKATSVRIGPSSMGTRFNVQMLIQVPLKQKLQPPQRFSGGFGAGAPAVGAGGSYANDSIMFCCAPQSAPPPACAPSPAPSGFFGARRQSAPPIGVSNAARVSRGSHHGIATPVPNRKPERDASMHGTITVTMYYTVVGGVPSAEDVRRAVEDLDELYKKCPSDKRLVECHEVTAMPKSLVVNIAPTPNPFVTPIQVVSEATAIVSRRPCTCRAGHELGEMTMQTQPPNGWWCDGCGVYSAYSQAIGMYGWSCRQCDYDLCVRCRFVPACSKRHALRVVSKADLGDATVAQCKGCQRQFATHVAVLRGCVTCLSDGLLCQACYTSEAVRRNL
jgi:hypothetical protein